MRPGLVVAVAALMTSVAVAQTPTLPATPVVTEPTVSLPVDRPCVRAWVGAEYLLWFTKQAPVPPLASTGPFNPDTFRFGVDPGPGTLGTTGTQVLFGGNGVNYGAASGARLTAGVFLDAENQIALEGSAFMLEHQASPFAVQAGPNGRPFLGIPFYGANTGQEQIASAAFAGTTNGAFGGLAGGINAFTSTRLWGAEMNLSSVLVNEGAFRVTGLLGVRQLKLDEGLGVNEFFTPVAQPLAIGFAGGPVALGDSEEVRNLVRTHNQFWGGQVGARWEWVGDLLTVGLTTKVALGNTWQSVDVAGSTTRYSPGLAPVTVPGGVVALPSNIGTTRRSSFTCVPEVGLNVGVQVTSWLRATVGYTGLYWTDVARPGNQIDRAADTRTIPSGQFFDPTVVSARPAQPRNGTDFWAHGVNIGLAIQY